MSRAALPLSIAVSLLLVRLIGAQCVTSSYVPCLPDGDGSEASDSVPVDDFDDSEYWDLLGNLASDPIGKRAASRPLLASRQNALCCAPTNQCLVLTDGNIPFCYDSDTTRFFFSDDSYGYLSNGTYYAADGTFVDFKDGYYSSADGTTGTFAPAAASGTAAATSSDVGAAATSTTVHAASRTTASVLATKSPVESSSSVGTTQHTSVTASTTTPSGKSGGATIKPADVIGWLGFCVACFGVFLA